MKNSWKILGGCGCASMLAGVALLIASVVAGDAALPWQRKPELAQYQNSREGRTGNLAENYVDFSFDHPKTWELRTNDPDNVNFVTAERRVNSTMWENLNVGYHRPAPTEAENQTLYRRALGEIEGQFSQQFRDFKKVNEGPTKIGAYTGHEALYSGWVEEDGKRVDVFTRAVFVATPDATRGVSLMMMGTSLCPDLDAAEDLGHKGELPLLLDSFKFSS